MSVKEMIIKNSDIGEDLITEEIIENSYIDKNGNPVTENIVKTTRDCRNKIITHEQVDKWWGYDGLVIKIKDNKKKAFVKELTPLYSRDEKIKRLATKELEKQGFSPDKILHVLEAACEIYFTQLPAGQARKMTDTYLQMISAKDISNHLNKVTQDSPEMRMSVYNYFIPFLTQVQRKYGSMVEEVPPNPLDVLVDIELKLKTIEAKTVTIVNEGLNLARYKD